MLIVMGKDLLLHYNGTFFGNRNGELYNFHVNLKQVQSVIDWLFNIARKQNYSLFVTDNIRLPGKEKDRHGVNDDLFSIF
jgi:hypothetical protein